VKVEVTGVENDTGYCSKQTLLKQTILEWVIYFFIRN